jgi:uncharacterized protein (UPF0276 family)
MRRIMIGIGYRHELADWIDCNKSIDCIEITAEHFFASSDSRLKRLRGRFPVFVHALSLSLGTPGPLDPDRVERFARVVNQTNPDWISEHVAFTRAGDVDLGHLTPILRTEENLQLVSTHARELSERCGKSLLLENITTDIAVPGEMDEPEFLNRLCAEAGCGLLLDVTNALINAHNHRHDPYSWFSHVKWQNIRQLHIAGYVEHEGRWADTHAAPINEVVLEFTRFVLSKIGPVPVIIEWDHSFPEISVLDGEVSKIRRLFA